MKKTILITLGLACALAFLVGCASADFSFGKDFDSSRVSAIAKGKTSAQELLQIIGQAPHQKSILGDGSEVWVWSHAVGESKATSVIITTSVKTTMTGKTLTVKLRDGVVENFSYSEGPVTPGAMPAI